MNRESIYLDNNATTPLDPGVKEVMLEVLEAIPSNPSSIHAFGRRARNLVTKARRLVADLLGVRHQQIVFTSSATEGINTVLRGLFADGGGHLVTSSVEHAAVFETAQFLAQKGTEVSFLDVGETGRVEPGAVAEALNEKTRLIAVMAANNETGVVTDLRGLAHLGIPMLIDGVASIGKEGTFIPHNGAFVFSGHKIHGPTGIGVLVLPRTMKIPSLITGGHQESGRRGGTENVAGIVGVAEALRLALDEMERTQTRMAMLRDRFERKVRARVPGVEVNGTGPRVCTTSNLYFPGVSGESLLMALDLAGVAASHGSACTTGSLEPSRVLLSMGYSRERARSSIRFSLSRMTSEDEIDSAIENVIRLARGINALSRHFSSDLVRS